MRIRSLLHTVLSLVMTVNLTLASKNNPLQSVQVTLRGEVYQVDQVTTVGELQERLEEQSGWDANEQGRVSFQGQLLEDSSASLSDVGMKNGDQVNMIPKGMADHWKMMKDMGHGLLSLRQRVHFKGPFASPQEQQEVQVLTSLYGNLMKAPFMQEEMERYLQFLKDPATLERAQDPERIESLRLVILNNPMLMQYVSNNPGAEQALQNSDSWYQHVLQCMKHWRRMESYELWQRLVDGRLLTGDYP